MPIIVRHDGSPLMAGLDAAAGAAGNGIAGQAQGMGGLSDMLMRLAQAQIADQASQRQFDRNVQMATLEDKMIRGRSQEGFDRARKAEEEDRNKLRDQEMQDAAQLAMAYGNQYNVFPPVGLTTRRDVEHWAAGLQADKAWGQQLDREAQGRQYKESQDAAERGRERSAVERVAPSILPNFWLQGQTPQTFDELKVLYGDPKAREDRADTERRLTDAATKQRESEDRLRYAANVQALSKQGEIIQGLIASAQKELAGMKDPQFGGIAKGMESQAKELTDKIRDMQLQAQNIAKAVASLTMAPAAAGPPAASSSPRPASPNAPAGAAAGDQIDAIIQDLMTKGLTDAQIAAELQKMGLH